MHNRLYWLIFFFALPVANAEPPTGSSLDTQRQVFRQLYPQAELGQWESLGPLRKQLVDYVLFPDLRAAYLNARLSRVSDAEIEAFLDTYADLWISRRLRGRWLQLLAKQQRWETFLEQYRAHYRPDAGARLECRALTGRLRLGETDAITGEGLRIWLSGKSQPKECDPVFAYLKKSGALTPARYRQRLDLAIRDRQFQLAAYLARSLDDADRARVARWRRMGTRSAVELARPRQFSATPEDRALVQYGMERLSRRDPDEAATLWPALRSRLQFAGDTGNEVEYRIALWSARKYRPDAAAQVRDLPPGVGDDEAARWRIRVGLRNQDWADVLEAIGSMSDEVARESTWRYWQARALAAQGYYIMAEQIYLALAGERSYYGFLAADRMELPYAFRHKSTAADETIIGRLATTPELIRARELFAVDLDSRGRIEWQEAMANLDTAERAQASLLAHRWGWYSRAISAASSGGLHDDLDLRFPAPYRAWFEALAGQANIPVTWAYGIARSESLFMRDVASPAGAIGLMQLMPATGKRTARQIRIPYRGRESLLDPHTNITLGTSYLGKMLQRFDGHQVLATAAYNAGPHRVDEWLPDGASIDADIWVETVPFRETRGYLQRVLASEVVFNWRLYDDTLRLRSIMKPVTPREAGVQVAANKAKTAGGPATLK